MRSANHALLDDAVRHAILTERFKNDEVRRILRILKREVLPDLRARLAARLANIKTRGYDSGPATTERVAFLLKDLQSLFKAFSKRLEAATTPRLVRFATASAAKLAADMRAQVGTLVSIATPTEKLMRAALLQRDVGGRLLKEHWQHRAEVLNEKVAQQIRIGLAQSKAPEEIIRSATSVFPGEQRKLASMVRTAVAHAQNQARQATYEENDDILKGVMWVATLDVSTCPLCGELDGELFPVDEGERPPLHEGPCRCTTVPVLRSASALGGERASMDGEVPGTLRYSDWIANQSEERQDQIFGKGIAELFRQGRIGLDDMVDAGGQRLSLDEIERLLTA